MPSPHYMYSRSPYTGQEIYKVSVQLLGLGIDWILYIHFDLLVALVGGRFRALSAQELDLSSSWQPCFLDKLDLSISTQPGESEHLNALLIWKILLTPMVFQTHPQRKHL